MSDLEIRENPVTKHQQELELQNILSPEVKEVLKLFEQYGYTTAKGSNSFILANILVDYSHRVLKERAKMMSYLNFWETDDIAVASKIAYEKYRIYNTRTIPELYNPERQDLTLGETYNNLPAFNQYLANANAVKFSLGQASKIKEPIKLKIFYDEIYSSSYVFEGIRKIENVKYFESFMDSDGVYIEQDYVILPDDDGYAVFKPLNSFYKRARNSNENLILLLFTERKENLSIPLKQVSERVEITCDYLRFVASELMAKFAILNRMSSVNFLRFLTLRYQKPFLIDDNRIISVIENDDILEFALKNVIPPMGKTWEFKVAQNVKIKILNDELLEYLNKNSPVLIKASDIDKILDFHIEAFWREKEGINYKDFLESNYEILNNIDDEFIHLEFVK